MSVVAGVTDTPLGRKVLERSIDEALLRGTSLVLVTSVPTPRSREEALEDKDVRVERQRWLDGLADDARAGGLAEVEAFLPTTPANLTEAVFEAAERPGAQLIVIGVPRRSKVGKAVLGSDAQEILLRSDLPVLGVKLPADSEH